MRKAIIMCNVPPIEGNMPVLELLPESADSEFRNPQVIPMRSLSAYILDHVISDDDLPKLDSTHIIDPEIGLSRNENLAKKYGMVESPCVANLSTEVQEINPHFIPATLGGVNLQIKPIIDFQSEHFVKNLLKPEAGEQFTELLEYINNTPQEDLAKLEALEIEMYTVGVPVSIRVTKPVLKKN